MKIGVFLLISILFAFELEKVPNALQYFYPGADIPLLPFRLTKFKDSQNFEVFATCLSGSGNGGFRKNKFTGTGKQVNSFFAEQMYTVPLETTTPLEIRVEVVDPKIARNVSSSHVLTLINHIPVNLVINKTLPSFVYPLRIAEILPPFNRSGVKVKHVDPHGLFNFTVFNGGVELSLLEKNASGVATFVLHDAVTSFDSHPLKIQISPLKNSSRKTVYYTALGISLFAMAAIIAGMYIQSKMSKAAENNSVTYVNSMQAQNPPNSMAIRTIPGASIIPKN